MEKLKPLLPFFLLIVLAAVLIGVLYPSAHPYGGINLPLDAAAIREKATQIATELGTETEDLTLNVQFSENQKLLRQVRQEMGIKRGNEVLRERVPGYYWEVQWVKREGFSFSFGNRHEESRNQREKKSKDFEGNITVRLDLHGRLIGYGVKIPDSIRTASLSQLEAKKLANAFLMKYALFQELSEDSSLQTTRDVEYSYNLSLGKPSKTKLESEKKTEQPHRTDYEFAWSTYLPEIHDKVIVKVGVVGNAVVTYQTEYIIPEKYKSQDAFDYYQLVIVVLYVAGIILMIVIAFKRIRAFEIGFRVALLVGGIVALELAFELFMVLRNETGWGFIGPLLFGPLFYGGGLIVVWAVSESVVRETWKEKMVSLDLLSRGYFTHPRIGEQIIKGIACGAGALAVWLGLIWIIDKIVPVWIAGSDDNSMRTFDAFSPALYVLNHSSYANAYALAFLIMFMISYLRRWTISSTGLIVVSALVLGLMNPGHLQPVAAGIIIQMVVGFVIVWAFYRYDVLAAYITLFTMAALKETSGLFGAGHAIYSQSAWGIVGCFAVVLVASITMLYRKDEGIDFDAIAPAFARHITERQRLQQELEIARQVQMSFLPKANPTTYKLDIASRCAPALEIGGDYYDFIELSTKRLGIAVGDVSGKGTQAAFFMTLTKGFLRALAKVSDSPAAVLAQVNKLFYENVERGVFISMVYGIFDNEQHLLTFARAGHNPVIMRKEQAEQVQVVNPMGLALGLDPGDTFTKSIQEVNVPFQRGDLFVFYTDGFPEAMNKTLEEFGQERLCKTVEQYAHGSATEIMEGVFSEMKHFTGKAKQHDDMTIVVVKVA